MNPDIQFASPEAEANYRARLCRLVDAVELRKPERAAVHINAGFWPAHKAGLTADGVMHDAGFSLQDFASPALTRERALALS